MEQVNCGSLLVVGKQGSYLVGRARYFSISLAPNTDHYLNIWVL